MDQSSIAFLYIQADETRSFIVQSLQEGQDQEKQLRKIQRCAMCYGNSAN